MSNVDWGSVQGAVPISAASTQSGNGLANAPIIGGALNAIANIAPTALGVAGNVAGNTAGVVGAGGAEVAGLGPEDPAADIGAAGSLAFGNRVLAPALSGIGQGAGEAIKKGIQQGLLGEPNNETFGQNLGDIAKNTAEGTAYGMVPGGQLNPLARFASGALAGGANQTIQDVGVKNPLEDVGGIAKNAGISGVLNALLPGVTSKLFEGAPAKIQKNIAISQFGPEAAANPEVAALAHPDSVVSETNVNNLLGDTADNVNNQLSKLNGNVNAFKADILKQAGISQSDPRFKEVEDMITKEQQKIADEQNAQVNITPEAGASAAQGRAEKAARNPLIKGQVKVVPIATQAKPGVSPDEARKLVSASDVTELPLNVLNQIRSSIWGIGKGGENDRTVQQMYWAARGNVKDNFTGRSKELESLWNKQEALQIAQKNVEGINKTKGAAPALNGGGMGYISPFLALRIPVIGPALALGMMGQRVMRNPDVSNSVGQTLSKGQNISDILRQLGLRSAGMGNGGQ